MTGLARRAWGSEPALQLLGIAFTVAFAVGVWNLSGWRFYLAFLGAVPAWYVGIRLGRVRENAAFGGECSCDCCAGQE